MSGLVTKSVVLVALTATLAGCAEPPLGPTVYAQPQTGKPFDVFAQENEVCKSYASGQVAGEAERANNQGLAAAAVTTVLGAGLGAAIGGGRGAAIGAASGAVVGSSIGASESGHSNLSIQAQYNNAFSQCMTAKGNSVVNPVRVAYPVYAPAVVYPGYPAVAAYPAYPVYPAPVPVPPQ